MNDMPVSEHQEPPSDRPGRPVVRGDLRRLLQELFPDLDPDVVGEVLDLTGAGEVPGERTEPTESTDRQGER